MIISTHVLDLARGAPAAGIAVVLEVRGDGAWRVVAHGTTDDRGRIADLASGSTSAAGTYRLTFDTAAYHRRHGIADPFFPDVRVTFDVSSGGDHFHVPLLLSPYGYSTYRGS
jgi:5-hydroxyisourate hydrolase